MADESCTADAEATGELTLPRLVAGLLAGCTTRLPVHDLARLACTCRALHQVSEAVPPSAFWQHVNLGLAARPTMFLALPQSLSCHPRFSGVRELTLAFCPDLRDDHLHNLPTGLRRLTLNACHEVTDAGVKALAACCGKRLEWLHIYWNKKLTTASALAVSFKCPHLTSLSLSGCGGIGAAGVCALAARLSKLTLLNLTRLPLVDDVALAAALQANPQLTELRLYAANQYAGEVPFTTH
jgi:hypothetical protein